MSLGNRVYNTNKQNMKLYTRSSEEKGTSFSNAKYKVLRNYQAEQQAILLGLLNQSSEIVISKPPKKTSSTLQFLNIKSITFNNQQTINFDELIMRRREEKILAEMNNGIPEKTAVRRMDNFKFTECLHALTDLLFLSGYLFNVKQSTGKNNDKYDTLLSIYFKNTLLYNTVDIENFGSAINTKIVSVMDKSNNFTLHQGDLRLFLKNFK
ncbi:hypothetical protein EIN_380740 [Entamoeba invadens IP1]|uniref:Uncharacterized protein n=1 Tax=Entamoeba invadens IP1 TaxID=370355 RepID=A0A0A1UAP0_ENTIV|nr:hypothetical protein EIN_380740 [Entamoeba invadens IP1]ELP92127.1 hypothetical protein EIN_380740 [Entamoeba invadens IP1]|eukprot:XP_004258898.1 hypothetical protein EIN_380740 [Entamoeba invadens IP1]